jgi:hypothetical protein
MLSTANILHGRWQEHLGTKLPDFPGPYRFALTFQDQKAARRAFSDGMPNAFSPRYSARRAAETYVKVAGSWALSVAKT